jgi:hypothetical protein
MAYSFLLILVSVSAARARFSLQQIMSSPFPSQLVAARTGGLVAWLFNLKGVRNVWVSDATTFVARQVTHYSIDDGMPLTSLRLTPDGRTVLYVRGSETNSAGEVANPTGNSKPPKQQVWAVDVDRGEPRLLGDMDCGQAGCEDIQVSPDGQSAVWITRHQLGIAPVSGVQPAHQLTYARGDNSDPKWSPQPRKPSSSIIRVGYRTVRFAHRARRKTSPVPELSSGDVSIAQVITTLSYPTAL